MNIKFNYLYRDAGNYKTFGYEVFANPHNLSLDEIEKAIRAALIDEEYFYPEKWNVKRLKFEDFIEDFDHSWNEFESVEYTKESATHRMSISEFLHVIDDVMVNKVA